MRILLSNDDGVHARGLKVLLDALKRIGDVTVVAPLEEKSTTGHSLTLHKPLRMISMGDKIYGVSGGPADCIHVGIQRILGKKRPDLVVSGINRGANLGQDVYYSGTVSAAREACIMGIPSMAVSLAIDFTSRKVEEKLHYETAARITKDLIVEMGLHERKGGALLPPHTFFNLNVPDLPLKRVRGVELASQGFRYYDGSLVKRRDHRGKEYFWVGGAYRGFRKDAGTDCVAVDNGFASLTPVRLDCTDHRFLSEMRLEWNLWSKGKKRN
jgi:5'-nucleotidase